MRSARVFISCGQQTDRETQIGLAVVEHFRNRGFETYFAERMHSAEGLTENIFRMLEASEYFVFMDFAREPLAAGLHRGSLFVNQELAIATFLRIPGIGFAEKGTKREGILGYQLWNAVPFEDGTQVISALQRETADWDVMSVNELAITYDPTATTKGIRLRTNGPESAWPLSDWYKLRLQNRNRRLHARRCVAYVTSIRNRESGDEYDLPSVELNWSSIGHFEATITRGATRDLDVFYLVHGDDALRFHTRALGTTNPKYHLPRLRPGSYDLEFAVLSDNFADATSRCELTFDGTPESVQFGVIPSEAA